MDEGGEALLLAVLNSTPVVGAETLDDLAGDGALGRLRTWGGEGSAGELDAVRAAREDLQAVVRGQRPAQALAAHLDGVVQVPATEDGHLSWRLQTSGHRLLAARVVLAYFASIEQAPGRLRACGNEACRLFLVDHSRAGTARWCSMATCGNRMKARRHADRTRNTR